MLKKSLALLCCLMLAVAPLSGVPLFGVLEAKAATETVYDMAADSTIQNATSGTTFGWTDGFEKNGVATMGVVISGSDRSLSVTEREVNSGVDIKTSLFADNDTEYTITINGHLGSSPTNGTSATVVLQASGDNSESGKYYAWLANQSNVAANGTFTLSYTASINGLISADATRSGFDKFTITTNNGNPNNDTTDFYLDSVTITEVDDEGGGEVDGDGEFSDPIEIPIANWSKSNALASFENGTVTYGTQDYANAYVYADIPATPSNYPNLYSFTFSYQGPDRYAEEEGNGLGGSIRLLAVTSSEATGGYMGGDSWVDARTIGKVVITGATASPVEETIIIDREKLASLGAVKRFVLYLPSGTKINGNTTSFTYSDISVVFTVDCCDGTCDPCECVGYCKFVNEGECCYAPAPPTDEAACIEIDVADLQAVGATLDGGVVTLTEQYGGNFVYFDVALPEGNTIYDYESLSASFVGISGDNPYKSLKLSAGAPKSPAGTFASYTPIANDVGNNLDGSTGTWSSTFNFKDSALRELYDASIPVVRFAINMPAAVSSVVDGENNITVAGPTVFEISDIKLNSKSCIPEDPCDVCYVPPLPGDNYTVAGEIGRHAPTKYGYDYEIWSQRVGNPPMAPGLAVMNIPPASTQAGKGGIFNATWVNTHNLLIRAGKKFSTAQGMKLGTTSTASESYAQLGEIAIDFETDWATTDNVAYLSVYGWAFYNPGSEPTEQENGIATEFSNEIEYYIVQDRKSYNPTGNSTKRGSATIDGILYDFYVTDRIGQPMLNSDNGNFKQYWSMPHDPADFRQSGTISVSEHFRAWEEAGMLLDGPLYEVAWKVESYTGGSGANGYANVTKNILTIDGVELKEPSKPDSGSSSSGSSGSGGGGGGSGTPTVVTSPNVSANGSVNSQAISSEANKALAAAGGDTAILTTKNAQSISAATLKTLASAAKKAGKAIVIHADTLSADNRGIQGRLYVDPAKLTNLTADLKLAVYTDTSKTVATKSLFEKYYDNKVSVIRCEQQGSFGAKLKIAAKVNLAGMDAKKLVFYSYDKTTKKFAKIADTAYFIDKNGYLHFYTAQAGDIVISEGNLAKK